MMGKLTFKCNDSRLWGNGRIFVVFRRNGDQDKRERIKSKKFEM